MINIDNLIREELGIEDKSNTKLCVDAEFNKINKIKVNNIVNNFIAPIPNSHNIEDEKFISENGYCHLGKLFSDDEVNELLNLIKNEPGYNYHIAANSYNREAKVFTEDLDWNVLSYEPSVFLRSKTLLDKITKPEILSLVQSYLGCFPTMYSVNCVWSKFTNQEFKTQLVHRDYDDFKFVSFFVFLTDIDDNNGPHMYYPKTQNGEDQSEEPIIVKGEKGTAFLADVYGLHNGVPLKSGNRCLLWCRFGLMLNNMHYKDQCNLFATDSENIFDKIEDNEYNRYLLRGFLKD
jgi:hypothetical protein